MKKMILFLAVSLAMVSCSSDDSNSSKSDNEKLVGQWKLTAFTSGFLDGGQDDEFNECYAKQRLNFTSTSKVTVTESEYNDSTDICSTYDISNVPYSVMPETNKLVISVSGMPLIYNYEFVSDSKLKITFNEGDDFLYIYTFTKM